MGAHKIHFNAMFVPVLVMAILALSTTANAAVVRYNSGSEFDTKISEVVQEYNFNSLSFGVQSNPLTISNKNDASFLSIMEDTSSGNPFPTGNDIPHGTALFSVNEPISGKYLAASASDGGQIWIDFLPGVSAIGLDVGVHLIPDDLFDPNDTITFLYKLWFGDSSEYSEGAIDTGGVGEFSFIGLVSDSGNLNRLELKITSHALGIAEAIDNVTLGIAAPSAVPVPAALPLFGTGLAFLGFMGWRRKRRAA